MTPVATLPNPSTVGTELELENKLVVGKLANVTVRSTSDLEQAVLDRQDLGARAKRVEDFFEPFISAAYKMHRALCDRKNEILAPILTLDQRLKRAMTDYKADEDRRRREEEQRISIERKREEEARLVAEAAHLEASGEPELAAAAIEQAIAAPATIVVLPDATAKIEGLKFRTEWKWRYANNDVARAMQLIPREYLCVDEKRINGYVRSMKSSGKIPGVEIYSEQIPVR